jgi:hypothetical protein
MMLPWLTLLFLLALALILLRRVTKTMGLPLTYRLVAIVFLCQVTSGILYRYFDQYSGRGGDSLNYVGDANWIRNETRGRPGDYLRIVSGIGDTTQHIREDIYPFLVTWKSNAFDFFFNSSRTVVRLHAVIRLFSFGNYNIHVLLFTFLSFLGQLLLFRFVIRRLDHPPALVFLCLALLPSAVVWYSGVMKEPLVMLGTGMMVSGLDRLAQGSSSRSLLTLLAGLTVLLLVKFYVVICMLPGAVLMAWTRRRPNRWLLKSLLVALVLFAAAVSLELSGSGYRPSYLFSDQLSRFVKFQEYFYPGTRVEHTPLRPDFGDLLRHLPGAWLHAVTTPLPGRTGSLFLLPFTLENILLLLGVLVVLFRFRLPAREARPLLLFSLWYVILLDSIVGLTTPFDGAIIRFRSVTLPFLLFSLFALAKPGRLSFPFLRKSPSA